MTTLTEIAKNQPVSAGCVELINLYGLEYGLIAVDGQVVTPIMKDSVGRALLDPAVIQQCVALSGVPAESLAFTYVDFQEFAEQRGLQGLAPMYDSNDFFKYPAMVQFLQQYKAQAPRSLTCKRLCTGTAGLFDALEDYP